MSKTRPEEEHSVMNMDEMKPHLLDFETARARRFRHLQLIAGVSSCVGHLETEVQHTQSYMCKLSLCECVCVTLLDVAICTCMFALHTGIIFCLSYFHITTLCILITCISYRNRSFLLCQTQCQIRNSLLRLVPNVVKKSFLTYMIKKSVLS